MKTYNVAAVGASGLVGGELIALLEKRKFPVGAFMPFNSGRAGAAVVFKGKKYACQKPVLAELKKADLVFLFQPTRFRRGSPESWPTPACGA